MRRFTEANGILYYHNRILPKEGINTVYENDSWHERFGVHFFRALVVHRHFSVGYCIMKDIHWFLNVAKHTCLKQYGDMFQKFASFHVF